MKVFFKITENFQEYNVLEFHTTETLYSWLCSKNIKGLSEYEEHEFFITNIKNVSINGFIIKISELYFDGFNYIFGSLRIEDTIVTIFNRNLDEIYSLEIEL